MQSGHPKPRTRIAAPKLPECRVSRFWGDGILENAVQSGLIREEVYHTHTRTYIYIDIYIYIYICTYTYIYICVCVIIYALHILYICVCG